MNEFAIEKQFNKLFVIHDSTKDHCSFPTPDKIVTESCVGQQDKFLEHLKERLNGVKGQLNQFGLDEWHQHTKAVNPAGRILWHVRSACNPELLTQAWLKFYQILETFSLVPSDGPFLSLHLCEVPGAFVTALNHHIQNDSKQVEWRWKATSLNPHYEGNPGTLMVTDDRFLIKSWRRWDFGPDRTGDILKPSMGRHLETSGPYHLITADGSIDCQDDPGEQEATVAALLAAEATTAMAALRPGGHLVLKTFTWFEASSSSLLYVLSCAFEKVTAVKPVASKGGNSEVYLVCEGFKRLTLEFKEALWACYGTAYTIENVPEHFIRRVREGSHFFLELQVETIEKNIALYESGPSNAQKGRVRALQNTIACRYLEQFGLHGPVTKVVALLGDLERVSAPPCPWTFEQMQSIRLTLRSLQASRARRTLEMLLPGLQEAQPLDLPLELPQVPLTISVTYGRPFETATCSRFCSPWLLQLRRFCQHLNLVQPEESGPSDFVVEGDDWMRRLGDKLSTMERKQDLRVVNFNLMTYLNVGVLCLLAHKFKKTVLEQVTPHGCVFRFVKFDGLTEFTSALLNLEQKQDGLQLLELVPVFSLLYGDLHPLVEQANRQTVLRLAQATLALLPENIEVTD